MREFGPVHQYVTRVVNTRSKFVFALLPAAPAMATRQPGQAGVYFCAGHLGSEGSRGQGWVGPGAEQEKCFCVPLRLGEGSWPGQRSSILFWAAGAEAEGPLGEAPTGRSWEAELQLLCLVSLWSQGFR